MKQIISIVMLALLFWGFPIMQSTNAQFSLLLEHKEETCVTDYCETIVRQYTGIATFWRMSTRCIVNGRWEAWRVYEGQGLYAGIICGKQVN